METKKILGLDLGVTSIGWALIEEANDRKRILGMGSRIIPLGTDEKTEFSTGNKISKNQTRTTKRTQRKGYDRYQQRRANLTRVLLENKMFDEHLFKLSSIELWGLRSKAVKEKISLTELGRVLYHLNQKRGYKSSRSDANLDKKDTDYVAAVKSRHQELKDTGLTIGQKFYKELGQNEYYRIKEQVFPREAYIEEYDAIMDEQSKHYPSCITKGLINRIRNEIIYYQRPLKSQKGLVNICEFAGFETKDKSGKTVFVGPKVTPKSSPLFQLCKIWETVNNINLKVKNNEVSKYKWLDWHPTIEQKRAIVAYLNENEHLSFTELLKIIGFKKENVYANKQIVNGIKGNTTIALLKGIIDGSYLQFNVEINTKDITKPLVDKKTGEILSEELDYEISASFEQEPLYKIWHTIYSIKEEESCQQALMEKFGFTKEIASSLVKIDFTKQGFGNKSSKAIRKILPYLMRGHVYSDACEFAGYNHSNSLTKDERQKRVIAERLELLAKNSLRQPVVEKILNQSINIVNAIIDHYGKPDEIRIELARELKQSKDERNETEQRNKANERLNSEIASRLNELGLPSTRRYIQKYKFIFPSQSRNLKDAHVENTCIYCGKAFSIAEALTGDNFDVDHIVPKSLLFDDSQTNKVLVHRSCNAAKTNQTAYDFIAKKGERELQAYIERVDEWFKRGILSYSKMQRLKVSYEEYLERKSRKKQTEADIKLWESFIDRQLRETQYIAKKAKEIFEKICYQVTTTEGSVTAALRRLWGWDDVLMNLQLPKYRELGLTQVKEWSSDHGRKIHQKEEIIGWTKRDDHRHHAIDALVVACTKQGYIQRINTLNSSDVKDAMRKEIIEAAIIFDEKRNLLEQYLIKERPFNTAEVEEHASRIIISFKSGKKVATKGIRKVKINGIKKVVQKDIIIPRGALSEESVYGKINTIDKNKHIKYLFENPHKIANPRIKTLIENRLQQFDNDIKKAYQSIKKDPIITQKGIKLEFGDCFKEEYVIKYPLQSLKAKDIDFIVDKGVREIVRKHLEKFHNKEKEAFKEPVWFNKEKQIPIKTVRSFTGLSAVEPVSKDKKGFNIAYVKPGNNHHIAFYTDESGKKIHHLCTFWHAVERKKYGIPVVIKNPKQVWDFTINSNKIPDTFLDKLPFDKWQFIESVEVNEMFLLGLSKESLNELVMRYDIKRLSYHLYRVQKISVKKVNNQIDMTFRHHLETELNDSNDAKLSKRFLNIQSLKAFDDLNPVKVRVTNIGQIIF